MISFPLLPSHKNHNLYSTTSNLLRLGSDEQWLDQIKAALLENRFCLYLREINALATLDTQRAYDIICILMTEEGHKIPPEVFQPIAERYGLGARLNHWMIEQLIQNLSQISAQCLENYRFTIPLSSASFKDYHWLELIDSHLTNLGIYKDSIGFEVSETLALSDLVTASELMTHLQTLGYRLTLDNCGSQMVSFSYLQYLPIDYIKISKQFIQAMHEDLTDRAIVEMIHYLAQTMGLQTIAKGVDSTETLKMVMSLGVDYGQGRCLSNSQLLDFEQFRPMN